MLPVCELYIKIILQLLLCQHHDREMHPIFCVYSWIFLHSVIQHNGYVYSSVDGHQGFSSVGFLQTLLLQTLLFMSPGQICKSFSWVYVPGSENANSGICIRSLLMVNTRALSIGCAVFISHPQWRRAPIPFPFQHLDAFLYQLGLKYLI